MSSGLLSKTVVILLLLSITVFATANKYDMRVAYGSADAKNFGDIIIGKTAPSNYHTNIVSIMGGYRLAHNFYHFPFDIYVQAGLSKFLENGYNKDVYENTIALKGYYKFNFLHNQIRFGAAEGASYVYGRLKVEQEDALSNHGHTSHYLNYIELSFDFDVGKLLHYKPLYDTFAGVYLHHRSGIFGLINNVKKGGSNFLCYYVEKNF